ncbi:MAG TPA: iron-containing redox enzyme family protein [Alphaproteobacteria bacterium]|nr:iron-containing redox enzyme family protein [Alphaproteobacteria bacterium]
MLAKITTTPALDNAFYREWMSRPFTIEELQIFARNYGAFVKAFPDALAVLIGATKDVEAKTEYVKTLYSEMGYGNPAKVHSALLFSFLNDLALKMGHENKLNPEMLEEATELLPTTRDLLEGEKALYGDEEMSFGAQLALEWQAYTMLRKLYDGARNYMTLWSEPDQFHEACEYFYAHIGAAEKDHKDECLKAVQRYAVDEHSVEKIVEGYDRHLDLISGFWHGLNSRIAELSAKSTAAA